jgi:hypothetical protein
MADDQLRPPARGSPGQATSSSIAGRERPDRGPVTASVPSCGGSGAAGQGWTGRRPGDGCVPSRVPVGPVVRLRDGSGPGRRRRTRLRLPGGSARCTGAVGGGSRREPSCVEVGRRPEEHRRREARAADVGRQEAEWLGDRVVGRGHPGKRATGLGVLEAVRRTTSSGWLPWSREEHVRSGARARPSGERAPCGARGPGPSRRRGRAPDRVGQRVPPRPHRSGRRRRPPGLR